VGPRVGMDAGAKRKIPGPCRESNPGRTTRSPVAVLTELLYLTWLYISMDINVHESCYDTITG
jgi:hypothetical protein